MSIKPTALLAALALSATAMEPAPLAVPRFSRLLAKSPFQPSGFDVMRAAEKCVIHGRTI
ncbi:hypothetical protein [Pseudophaeobacter arcticus]|uniref:hypothetical protein n=1 Tax=Pseudophaeobacter arcticus TaxID=385492 RepID=UPI0039E336A0